MFEAFFIALCVALSIYKRDTWSGLMILSLSVVNEMAILLPVDDFIYHTILIVNYALFFKLIKIKLVKLALSILIMYSLAMFALSLLDMILYTDMTWNLVVSWSSLYEYVYYSTISLIFAGLAIGGQGGSRVNNTNDNLFSVDNIGINYQRIRSKFN